jgi:hypothetical protein
LANPTLVIEITPKITIFVNSSFRKKIQNFDFVFQVVEDTLTVARTMRAASPPASAADILEANANNRRYNRPG